MLNLVNQNKEAHWEVTSDGYEKKLHLYYISKGYMISHNPSWIHQY